MSNELFPAWIAVDWGTSHLRVWAMMEQGEVLSQAKSSKGMGSLSASEFEPALLELVSPWLTHERITPIICCGMVGARQGWQEARYQSVPANPVVGSLLTKVKPLDGRMSVHIIPGMMQTEPADVMRGEETQIAGFLARDPEFTGTICLPGTHTKWVCIANGAVEKFSTFMTGEMFALLSKSSVLRHSVSANGWDAAAFEKAVAISLDNPAGAAGNLFALRAETLISDLSPVAARARLSGLLIGLEMAAVAKYWQGQRVSIIGANDLSNLYCQALRTQNTPSETHNVETLTLNGLRIAFSSFKQAAG